MALLQSNKFVLYYNFSTKYNMPAFKFVKLQRHLKNIDIKLHKFMTTNYIH